MENGLTGIQYHLELISFGTKLFKTAPENSRDMFICWDNLIVDDGLRRLINCF